MASSDEIFVVHDVHCLTRGDVAVTQGMQLDHGQRQVENVEVRLRGRHVTRNRFEAYVSGNKTRFADRGRPRRQTGGHRP